MLNVRILNVCLYVYRVIVYPVSYQTGCLFFCFRREVIYLLVDKLVYTSYIVIEQELFTMSKMILSHT